MILLLALLACEPARRTAIAVVDQGYATPEGDLEAVMDGLDSDRTQQRIRLVPVAEGLSAPTAMVVRDNTILVAQKDGVLVEVDLKDGAHTTRLELDVVTVSEQGLLGIALHPKYPQVPRVFLNATFRRDGEDQTVVAAYERDAQGRLTHAWDVISVPQPYQNHNAGDLAFGPDGMLYIGMGDGGFRDDPHGHGQNVETLLGGMLRIDVDSKRPYAIPADNPYGGGPGRDELFAIGLRNPWRYTFDPKGRLVVADVGQNTTEEVTLVPKGSNQGWKIREGDHCFPPKITDCSTEGLTDPVHTYGRKDGMSITGGVVAAKGPLAGRYLFADFLTGRIWSVVLPESPGTPATELRSHGRWSIQPSSFALGDDGEVYVADLGRGKIYRLEPRPE